MCSGARAFGIPRCLSANGSSAPSWWYELVHNTLMGPHFIYKLEASSMPIS